MFVEFLVCARHRCISSTSSVMKSTDKVPVLMSNKEADNVTIVLSATKETTKVSEENERETYLEWSRKLSVVKCGY